MVRRNHRSLATRSACVALALALSHGAWTQQASGKGSEYERHAIQVAHDFMAAIAAKDPNRAASFLADDFQLHMDPAMPLVTGAAAIEQMKRTASGDGLSIKIGRSYALGGPHEVVVIQERTDSTRMQGKVLTGVISGVYRIDSKTWKIKGFADVQIDPPDLAALGLTPPGAGAAPPGAPPGGVPPQNAPKP